MNETYILHNIVPSTEKDLQHQKHPPTSNNGVKHLPNVKRTPEYHVRPTLSLCNLQPPFNSWRIVYYTSWGFYLCDPPPLILHYGKGMNQIPRWIMSFYLSFRVIPEQDFGEISWSLWLSLGSFNSGAWNIGNVRCLFFIYLLCFRAMQVLKKWFLFIFC